MSWQDVRGFYEERDDDEDWIDTAPESEIATIVDELIEGLAGNEQTPAEALFIPYIVRLRKRISEMEKNTEDDAAEIERLTRSRELALNELLKTSEFSMVPLETSQTIFDYIRNVP